MSTLPSDDHPLPGPTRPDPAEPRDDTWIRGLDVSEAPLAERHGVVFRSADGTPASALRLVRDHHYTWVRVRLMVDPDGRYGLSQDLGAVLALCTEANSLGLRVLLDLHYSDWWADPGIQQTPARWAGQDVGSLAASVYAYTRDVLESLRDRGTPPDMVQVGNEINHGMLWDAGRVTDVTAAGMANLVTLANAGTRAVRETGGRAAPPVMLHVAKIGDAEQTVAWYRAFVEAGGDFDVVGLSYYPMWHGDLDELARTIRDLRAALGRRVILAETASYWDRNQAGFTGLPFPETPRGQRDFLAALTPVVREAGGSGIIYWGAFWARSDAWLDAPDWSDDDASRRSLFDDTATALPAFDGRLL